MVDASCDLQDIQYWPIFKRRGQKWYRQPRSSPRSLLMPIGCATCTTCSRWTRRRPWQTGTTAGDISGRGGGGTLTDDRGSSGRGAGWLEGWGLGVLPYGAKIEQCHQAYRKLSVLTKLEGSELKTIIVCSAANPEPNACTYTHKKRSPPGLRPLSSLPAAATINVDDLVQRDAPAYLAENGRCDDLSSAALSFSTLSLWLL